MTTDGMRGVTIATFTALALTGGIALAQSSGGSAGGASTGGTSASPASPATRRNQSRRLADARRQSAGAVRSRHHRPRSRRQPGELAGHVAPRQPAGPDETAWHAIRRTPARRACRRFISRRWGGKSEALPDGLRSKGLWCLKGHPMMPSLLTLGDIGLYSKHPIHRGRQLEASD